MQASKHGSKLIVHQQILMIYVQLYVELRTTDFISSEIFICLLSLIGTHAFFPNKVHHTTVASFCYPKRVCAPSNAASTIYAEYVCSVLQQ